MTCRLCAVLLQTLSTPEHVRFSTRSNFRFLNFFLLFPFCKCCSLIIFCRYVPFCAKVLRKLEYYLCELLQSLQLHSELFVQWFPCKIFLFMPNLILFHRVFLTRHTTSNNIFIFYVYFYPKLTHEVP